MNQVGGRITRLFFNKCKRGENDAANKERELILSMLDKMEEECMGDDNFKILKNEWDCIIKKLGIKTDVPIYTRYTMELKGGRKFNYDADLLYYNGDTKVAERKVEFKNGASHIGNIPQFLSLQTRVELFPVPYDIFYYKNYLDEYLKCDPGIITEKPTEELYYKCVSNVNYSIHPFFEELKNREEISKKEKHAIVNKSIKDYLEKYSKSFDIIAFSKRVKDTQKDKHYLLWNNGKFYYDVMDESQMSNMEVSSIKNGNTLVIKSSNTLYNILLRWRNHKGILNPALQISMKRMC